MVTVHSALTFIVACACFRSAVANGKHTRVYKDGDYVIGGLLPIHNRMMSDVYERSNVCRQLALSHIISVEAMIYIIDKFNERSERLFRRSRRKIRIGYDFRDTCMHVPTAMHQAVGFVNDIEKWAEIADEAKKVCGHPKTNKCYCTFNQTKFKMPEVQGRLVNGRPYCSREDRWEKATMAPPSVSPKSEMTTSAPIYGNYSETNGTTSSRRRYRKQKKTLEPCLNKPIVGLVGPSSSFISAAVAGLFAIYNIPLVSYFSTRVLLSDRKYSSFFRTIPADDNQARAMAEIIERFKWNYVSTIATDLEYSREGIATLQRELKTREICLARDEIYNPRSPEAESQVRKIVAHLKQDDNVKVVVLFMYWQHAEQILAEASRQNLRRITWIACESWASNANVLEMEASVVQGIIGVGLPMYRDNDFLQFLQDRTIRQAINGNPWLRQYVFERLHWRKRSLPVGIHRKCNFTEHGFVANCSEELKLEDLVDKTRVLLAPINAANALMVLLTALIMALNDRQLWHKHELGLLTHRDILPFVAKADFPGFGGITINFRPGGDLQRAEYEILNVQKNAVTGLLEFAMIGNWSLQDDGGSSLKFDESKIQWNSVDNTVPVSICSDYCPPGEEVLPSPSECCWGCRPCAEGHVSNMSMSVECTYCPEHTYPSDNQTWCRPNTDITIDGTLWDTKESSNSANLSFHALPRKSPCSQLVNAGALEAIFDCHGQMLILDRF
ncbi:extracellular calcium-sensing receptor-like isoform X2 [Tubulanus polymorphus]|uniref:extracellular calcium-sensing receptor-like isoform X2 n=1 Tax=Tubulanus polymorphus TaxID=672921 RepID=UPI003DA5684D